MDKRLKDCKVCSITVSEEKNRENVREGILDKNRIENFPEFKKHDFSDQMFPTKTEWHININSDLGTAL